MTTEESPAITRPGSLCNAVDRAVVTIVVDNECDPLSTPAMAGHITETMRLAAGPTDERFADGHEGVELVGNFCVACHGYSAHVALASRGVDRTIVFDVGPSADIWLENAARLRLRLDEIDTFVVSHWHWDHTGGLPGVVAAVAQARMERGAPPPVVDLHPRRPRRRGAKGRDGRILLLPEDPTIEAIEQAGGAIHMSDAQHLIEGDLAFVSGAIPRRHREEEGLPGHVSDWGSGFEADPEIMDERFLALKIRGRGVAVFSACSHAGIVNVCTEAAAAMAADVDAVFGGLHLAGATAEPRIPFTVEALRDLDLGLIAPGHCTGWRARQDLISALSAARVVPSVVGATFVLDGTQRL